MEGFSVVLSDGKLRRFATAYSPYNGRAIKPSRVPTYEQTSTKSLLVRAEYDNESANLVIGLLRTQMRAIAHENKVRIDVDEDIPDDVDGCSTSGGSAGINARMQHWEIFFGAGGGGASSSSRPGVDDEAEDSDADAVDGPPLLPHPAPGGEDEERLQEDTSRKATRTRVIRSSVTFCKVRIRLSIPDGDAEEETTTQQEHSPTDVSANEEQADQAARRIQQQSIAEARMFLLRRRREEASGIERTNVELDEDIMDQAARQARSRPPGGPTVVGSSTSRESAAAAERLPDEEPPRTSRGNDLRGRGTRPPVVHPLQHFAQQDLRSVIHLANLIEYGTGTRRIWREENDRRELIAHENVRFRISADVSVGDRTVNGAAAGGCFGCLAGWAAAACSSCAAESSGGAASAGGGAAGATSTPCSLALSAKKSLLLCLSAAPHISLVPAGVLGFLGAFYGAVFGYLSDVIANETVRNGGTGYEEYGCGLFVADFLDALRNPTGRGLTDRDRMYLGMESRGFGRQ